MTPRPVSVLSLLLCVGVGTACARGTTTSTEPTPSASISAAPAPSDATAATNASAQAAPVASASTADTPSLLSGSWVGTYDAKRGSVKLLKSTPWPAWKKDAGKQVGKGSAELEIDEHGNVRGKAAGPLGPLRIVGRFEEGRLRASILPEDVTAEGSMSGILTGELKGQALSATLRVSNRRGEAVRVAELTMKRK